MEPAMKLSDYIVEFLAERGIDTVFGYIGGAITHLVDSIDRNDRVRFIQAYHEQTAAIAAEGFARISGKPGVAIATSGPGATNLITGIGDAFFDSIPVVFITGQVNTYEYKNEKHIRQQGFQETDIVSIVRPITKYATMLKTSLDIRLELEKAFYIAMEGRPGPVLLDIPMDLLRAPIEPAELPEFQIPPSARRDDTSRMEEIQSLLMASQRPILLAGGGVINARGEVALTAFACRTGIPVVSSLMGKGAFPEDHGLFIGMIGSYGNRCANIALANADLVLAVGSRLDTRQTGAQIQGFVRSGKIVHVDIDVFELDEHRIQNKINVCMDAKSFIELLNNSCYNYKVQSKWVNYLNGIRQKYSQSNEVDRFVSNKSPYFAIDLLNRLHDPDRLYFVDIGQNQMWAAQTLKVRGRQRFLTSGGMAPMGYAIPAAIGSAFAHSTPKNHIVITGDGGFQIATQGLLLISQYHLPIKILVLNNRSLGMITQFQDLYFNENKAGTTKDTGYLVPNIEHLAKAYSLPYYNIPKERLFDDNWLGEIFNNNKPAVIEIFVGEGTIVSPKLEYNSPLEDETPKLSREELKSAMLIDLYEPND
jgi:acetolactate synthase-1/2/3 large subunit